MFYSLKIKKKVYISIFHTATVVALFMGTIVTVLRSMVSRRVSSRDQGSYFAIIALLESLGYFVGAVLKNSIFTATLSWWFGFVYLSVVFIQLFNLLLITLVLQIDCYDTLRLNINFFEKS